MKKSLLLTAAALVLTACPSGSTPAPNPTPVPPVSPAPAPAPTPPSSPGSLTGTYAGIMHDAAGTALSVVLDPQNNTVYVQIGVAAYITAKSPYFLYSDTTHNLQVSFSTISINCVRDGKSTTLTGTYAEDPAPPHIYGDFTTTGNGTSSTGSFVLQPFSIPLSALIYKCPDTQ